MMTGRLPVHVLEEFSPACGDEAGAVPLNMTTLGDKLSQAGYMTHFVGKWDNGARYWDMLPLNRGFRSFLGILNKGTYSYSGIEYKSVQKNDDLIDFWDNWGPARTLANDGVNQEHHFRDRMLSILRTHDASRPLYMHYSARSPHSPHQAPHEYINKYDTLSSTSRRVYMAMVTMTDEIIGHVVEAFKTRGLWRNTLMVFSSDNGGVIDVNKACYQMDGSDALLEAEGFHGTVCPYSASGASNWPLMGGKFSFFEGGIRVAAFVSGGLIPKAMRGTTISKGIIHIADWYTTFCRLAGVDEFDAKGNVSELSFERKGDKSVPPVDGLDMWPTISRGAYSPRVEIHVNSDVFISHRWKFVRNKAVIKVAERPGPMLSNASSPFTDRTLREFTCESLPGCLFDVLDDASEYYDLCNTHQSVCDDLRGRLEKANEK
eukprot:5403236-Pleurochrysis_carterae.AAC.1